MLQLRRQLPLQLARKTFLIIGKFNNNNIDFLVFDYIYDNSYSLIFMYFVSEKYEFGLKNIIGDGKNNVLSV